MLLKKKNTIFFQVEYSNWAFAEPTQAEQNCAAMNGFWNKAGLWSDQSCNFFLKYVCELEIGRVHVAYFIIHSDISISHEADNTPI